MSWLENILVIKMKKIVELPLLEPIFSTYHNAHGSATIVKNPSIRNWYLNQVLVLFCNREFLKGYSTPKVSIIGSAWNNNPHLEQIWYPMQFLGGYVHRVIKKLIDDGYYVAFGDVDDYYIEGKTWYHKRHFNHDGCICGYNDIDKTYCIYAYDENWIYRKFWTPQKCFEAGRKSMFKEGVYGKICGIKPKNEQIDFLPKFSLLVIKDYLNSSMEKYPENEEGYVYGIVVHDYIAKYIGKLYDESIPYEKMDWRVLRLIWEHKKLMHERIQRIEQELCFDSDISTRYEKVVSEANSARMLYASHHMKRRDSLLPIIQSKLLNIKQLEQTLLCELLDKSKRRNIK